jgi:uncharacterized membrane protein YheB (UPF0754 family)
MQKMTVLEIPEEEVPKLEVSLAQAVARLREIDEEYIARQQRIAALGAETDQILEAIKRSLANVEKFLSATGTPVHLQR